MNYIKLDKEIIDIICCPLCKSDIKMTMDKIICENCATEFPRHFINTGQKKEKFFDFCLHYPNYCIPAEFKKWRNIQKGYEKRSKATAMTDDYKSYLKEIDSVKEIYTDEFEIKGKVLDVGGHMGRLRHFLSNSNTSLYISIDPYLKVFKNIGLRPNLLKAYPCLSKPCNFLACQAENLPFIDNTFDWVHMRSVIDHFQNPYLALKEAYRVLKPNGMLLIGTSIENKDYDRTKKLNRLKTQSNPVSIIIRLKNKIKKYGFQGIIDAIKIRLVKKPQLDSHMCEFSYDNLIKLIKTTNFSIEKVHRQKPPYANCIYVSAKKQIYDNN